MAGCAAYGQGLEFLRRLIGGHGEYDAPSAFTFEEGLDGVGAHVRREGDGVKIHGLEESPGIAVGSVAYVSALGICNDEDVGIG